MKKILAPFCSIALLLATVPAHAELRPAAANFAIVTNDDDVGGEELGWFWVGAGLLLGLGVLVFVSGEPNSPQ